MTAVKRGISVQVQDLKVVEPYGQVSVNIKQVKVIEGSVKYRQN